uniref:SFRICE_005918 n=1 Tax=Spodoptera frugiperda TaxID=7108 RepID=A0A2H1VIE2_SPOFR
MTSRSDLIVIYITSRLSPMWVGRDNGPRIATILTHLFRFINSHQSFHACSSVKGYNVKGIPPLYGAVIGSKSVDCGLSKVKGEDSCRYERENNIERCEEKNPRRNEVCGVR